MATPEQATTAERLRPADVCRRLLMALEATEGRRRKRKRNTTTDAIGLSIKRDLFEAAIAADPDPDDFEAWLLEYCLQFGLASGPVRAMALEVFDEYRLAVQAASLRAWLDRGAPSDDAERAPRGGSAACAADGVC